MELTIEKIQECKKVKEFLDDVCEKYFNANCDADWQYYSGWDFTAGNNIRINYTFDNFWSNTEMCTEWDSTTVTYEELIKFNEESKEGND